MSGALLSLLQQTRASTPCAEDALAQESPAAEDVLLFSCSRLLVRTDMAREDGVRNPKKLLQAVQETFSGQMLYAHQPFYKEHAYGACNPRSSGEYLVLDGASALVGNAEHRPRAPSWLSNLPLPERLQQAVGEVAKTLQQAVGEAPRPKASTAHFSVSRVDGKRTIGVLIIVLRPSSLAPLYVDLRDAGTLVTTHYLVPTPQCSTLLLPTSYYLLLATCCSLLAAYHLRLPMLDMYHILHPTYHLLLATYLRGAASLPTTTCHLTTCCLLLLATLLLATYYYLPPHYSLTTTTCHFTTCYLLLLATLLLAIYYYWPPYYSLPITCVAQPPSCRLQHDSSAPAWSARGCSQSMPSPV